MANPIPYRKLQAAWKVPCSYCGAARRKDCKTKGGMPMEMSVHQARLKAGQVVAATGPGFDAGFSFVVNRDPDE